MKQASKHKDARVKVQNKHTYIETYTHTKKKKIPKKIPNSVLLAQLANYIIIT